MKALIVSFKKIFTSRGFWLCVVMTFILLLSTEIYTDYTTYNKYSVITALTKLPAEEFTRHFELCRTMVMIDIRGGWLPMFIPIVTAFCFVPQMCAERDSGAVRFQMFRSSKLKYNLTQFVSGTLAAGVAVLIGYVLFCGAVYLLFPAPSEYSGWEAERIADYGVSFLKQLLEIGLYGVFHSIPAMFCTAVMRNKYLIMCIPFFVKYGLSQAKIMIQQNAFGDHENINLGLFKFTQIANPDGLLWIADQPDFKAPALFFGITAAVFTAAYLMIKQNRRDHGA